jgi:hypothetical protein
MKRAYDDGTGSAGIRAGVVEVPPACEGEWRK